MSSGSEKFVTSFAGQCIIDHECPLDCICDGTTVDCSNRGLSQIPTQLPMFTTTLYLNDNKIVEIKNMGLFEKLLNLKSLNLNNNYITRIESEAFHGAENMKELKLRNNLLTEINEKMLHGLSHLENLSLSNNEIKCIMDGTFDHLKYLKQLELDGNAFVCNCHLDWLGKFLRKRPGVSNNTLCSEPEHLRGMPVGELEMDQFTCLSKNLLVSTLVS
ncbi:unnamed protein product [Soboliphyme baturini]|uniref:LRRNT domain-containing protein n=1 Tax=Soboliphyme baturini TaxID=241478 RepID=A0A3P8GA28_9BILA|nr:unnamed protein product [Soboliphyme baturini]